MFWPTGPPRVGNHKIRGLLRYLGLGRPLALGEIPGAGRKWKTQLPGPRGPKTEKKTLPRYPGWLSATFPKKYVLANRTPTGGKSQNMGFFRPFWP